MVNEDFVGSLSITAMQYYFNMKLIIKEKKNIENTKYFLLLNE